MKKLVGLLAKLKYQTEEYTPQTLENIDNPELREDVFKNTLDTLNETILLIDNYVHKEVALIYEHKDIISNIQTILEHLQDTKLLEPQRVHSITDTDMCEISKKFIELMATPHNQDWLNTLLTEAVFSQLFQIEHRQWIQSGVT